MVIIISYLLRYHFVLVVIVLSMMMGYYYYILFLPWLLLLPLVVTGFGAKSAEDNNSKTASSFRNLVKWLRENGGRVDERLALETNSDGVRGIRATQDIPAGTELLFCPWKLVLGTEPGDTSTKLTGGNCAILEEYTAAIKAGKDSFWWPYLAIDASLGSRVPTFWGNAALEELQGLPPYAKAISSNLTKWFVETCTDADPDGNFTPFEKLDQPVRQALFAAITRGADMRFLPLYDLFNHDNGLLNTQSEGDKRGDSIVSAMGIPLGSEVYVSYRGGRTTVSEMFQRYGFIEGYPQQWVWADPETLQEERFLCLPDGAVIINPTEAMTLSTGTTTEVLGFLMDGAEQHNSKATVVELEQFKQHFQGLLESLPTIVGEDIRIVATLMEKLESLGSGSIPPSNGNSDNEHHLLGDRISAIQYRIYFKEAIQLALDVADDLLATSNDQIVDKEL